MFNRSFLYTVIVSTLPDQNPSANKGEVIFARTFRAGNDPEHIAGIGFSE